MFYTYVLDCTNSKSGYRERYVGWTEDLQKRVIEHQAKGTKSTKSFDKINLIYFEACINKTDPIRRERQLKTGFGRGYIKRRLKTYFDGVSRG